MQVHGALSWCLVSAAVEETVVVGWVGLKCVLLILWSSSVGRGDDKTCTLLRASLKSTTTNVYGNFALKSST